MPAEEFAGKVKRSDTFWKPRFCAHPKAEPYSYLAQRAGKKKKKDLGMLARRPWSKVLAEELRAGRERGSPGRAGPKLGLGGGCRGWTPVTRAGWGAGGPLAARSCTPGSPPAPGEVPASKLETSPLGAASRPPS